MTISTEQLIANNYNPQEITAFLQFLDPTVGQYFTCAFLDSESKQNISGYGVRFGKVEQIVADLDKLVGVKPTLHVTLNSTDHKGRRKENVTGTRVLCLDLDNFIGLEEIKRLKDKFKPHCIVRSSSNDEGAKYHLYWRISNVSLESWSVFQLAIAQHFNGDKTLDGIAKTIRVPGVERKCKDGSIQMPEMVYLEGKIKPLNYDDILALFPWYDEEYKKAKETKELEREALRLQWKELNKGRKKGEKVSVNPKESGRNNALWHELYGTLMREEIGANEAELLILAYELNEAFGPECGGALSNYEVENVVDSALRTATDKLAEKAEAKERKKAESKALLSKMAEIAAIPTNGFAGIFEYDYSVGSLRENRFTTLATVQRVLQRYLKYLARIGDTLYAFDDNEKIWRPQNKKPDIINDFVATCVRDIYRDPEFNSYFSTDKLKAALEKFSSHSFLSGVQQQLCLSSKIKRFSGTDFDRDSDLFFCANGVLNLRNGSLRDAKPEDMLLHRSGVIYDPNAEYGAWIEFLDEVFQDNENPAGMKEFLQRLFGYSLTGGIEAQKLFIHFGSGSNGKSKILQALSMLLGGYAAFMDGKGFLKSAKSSVELERVGARIAGRRLCIIDDLDTKAQWSEGIVKNLTSPTLVARRLYEEEANIPNRAKFHIGCNERPVPESQNYGLLRRLCIIPYPRQFEPSAEKEQELQEMLVSQLSGILNWALKGRIGLLDGLGFKEPSEVGEMIIEYKREHFGSENAVERLLERVSSRVSVDAPEYAEHWHTINEILEHVNNGLESLNLPERYNVTTIGTLLKSKFNAPERRVQVNRVRVRQRLIILKSASLARDILA